MKLKIFILSILITNLYSLSFEELKTETIKNSTALENKRQDINISKKELEITEADRYPQLKLSSDLESSKSYSIKNGNVNNQSISSANEKKSYLALSLEQNLIDFGRQNLKEEINKEDIYKSENQYLVHIKQSLLSLLDSYDFIVQKREENIVLNKMLEIKEETLKKKELMFENNNLNKQEILNQTIENKLLKNKILKNKIDMKEHIQNIFKLTFVDVSNETLEPLSLIELKDKTTNNKELAALNNEINIKIKNIDLLNKDYFPMISFYSKYDVYGSNENKFDKALNEMDPNSFRLGISLTMELFNGFKTKLNKDKISLELKQKQNELFFKEKEFKNELDNIIETIEIEKEIYIQQQKLFEHSLEKHLNNERLFKNGEIDLFSLFETKIEILNKELDFKNSFNRLKYLYLKEEQLIKGDDTCNHY